MAIISSLGKSARYRVHTGKSCVGSGGNTSNPFRPVRGDPTPRNVLGAVFIVGREHLRGYIASLFSKIELKSNKIRLNVVKIDEI